MNYDVGDLVKVKVQLRDEGGVLANPTDLVLKTRAPSGAKVEEVWPGGNIVEAATGQFYCTVPITESGVWLYEWVATGTLELTEPGELVVREDLFDASDPAAFAVAWRPELTDVGALIHARTIVPGGNRIGTFNSETEPTDVEVERLINIAVRSVASEAGSNPCTAPLRADARAMAAYVAAALVEQSFWPEQTISAQSTYAGLMKLAERGLGKLEERIEANCGGGGEEGGEIEGGAVAAGSFDDGVEVLGRLEPPRW